MIAVPGSLTLDDFLRLPAIEESPAWEYGDGEVIQKLMAGGKHSRLHLRLAAAINAATSAYEALPELRCTVGGRSPA
jgi:Uma2 family endonuclease